MEFKIDKKRLIVCEISFDQLGSKRSIYPVLLVDENGDSALIDTGFPHQMKMIEEIAENYQVDLNRLKYIFITHHDIDHMGSLADLKMKYPSAIVISSVIEADYICGNKKSLRLVQTETLVSETSGEELTRLEKFKKALEKLEKCNVDRFMEDQQLLPFCGGIQAIATVGHTPGHLSFYCREFKTLITGDALLAENGLLQAPAAYYTYDMPTAIQSLKKLQALDLEHIVCYHGGLVTEHIQSTLQQIIDETKTK